MTQKISISPKEGRNFRVKTSLKPALRRNVIFKSRRYSNYLFYLYLLIWIVLLVLMIEPNDCKMDKPQFNHNANDKTENKHSKSHKNVRFVTRTKRWVDEGTQQTIPAANPNFEAAFQGECGKNNNSNPCEHICLDLHDGTYECSCFYGFTLAVDGYSCAPIAQSSSFNSNSNSSPSSLKPLLQVMPFRVTSRSSQVFDTKQYGINSSRNEQAITTRLGLLSFSTDTELTVNNATAAAGRSGGDDVKSTVKETVKKKPEETTMFTGRRLSGTLIGGRRANDNRKLVDELARGAKLNRNENGQAKNIEDNSSNNEVRRRRQRRLLDAAAWIQRVASNNQPPAYLAQQLGAGDEAEANIIMLRPQMKTASSGGNKGPAGDKWPSYDVDAHVMRDNETTDDELIGLSLGDEDMDLDIKSIMMSNDKLVNQLARSISSTTSALLANNRADQNDKDNNHGGDDEDKDENENEDENGPIDYELSLLEELVAKTIRDYARTELSQPLGAHLLTNEINEPASVSIIRMNQSSAGNRSRRSHHIASSTKREKLTELDSVVNSNNSKININMLRLPSPQIDNNRLCSDTDKPLEVYKDCIELPECESGGQCLIETKWTSNKTTNLAQIESRARCRCPIGRGGHLCQKPIQRSTPRFMGHSYLALPMITDPSLTNLRLVFKPEHKLELIESQFSLILYSQKFLLLLDDMSRIELRYLTNDEEGGIKVTRVIGSRDVEKNKWNELIVTDASNDSQTDLIPDLGRIVIVTPDKIQFDGGQNFTELFVAGIPNAVEVQVSAQNQQSMLTDGKSAGGFIGCIREFSINQRIYNFRSDLNGDTLDGFDIAECCR